MKRYLILAVLAIFAVQAKAQRLQGNYDASRYYAYDSTTFFLGAAKDVKFVYVEFPDLDADDAVLRLGAAGEDLRGAGYLSWTGTADADTLILDVSANTNVTRKSDGTRVTTVRYYFWFENAVPSNFLAVMITWNSVTEGRIKIYF